MGLIEQELAKYGLAGAVMGLVFYLVVKPLVGGLITSAQSAFDHIGNQAEGHRLERLEAMKVDREERAAAAAERERMCLRHQQHDEASLQALEGLRDSVTALVARANGGK